MSLYVFVKVVCSAICAALAAASIGRDPRLRVNWLVAMIPGAACFWALCEVLWNTQTDPDVAIVFVRLSSVAWLLLAPVGLDLFVELQGARSRLRRLVSWSYAFYAIGILLYNLTPYCVVGVHPAPWGWEPDFGPLFLPVYATVALPAVAVIATWRDLYPKQGSTGEKRVAVTVYGAVAVVLFWASANEVVMPLLGHEAPRHGTLSLTLVSLVVAWNLRRYGFSLISPGAFAQEILGSLRDGLALLLDDGTVRDANRAFEELAAVPPGGLVGARVSDLLPGLDPGEATFGVPVETGLATRSGGVVPVSVILCRLPQLAGIGRSSWGEALVVSDLREVTALKDRLMSSARLAAVGELSAGISEEISRPVLALNGYLCELREKWPSDWEPAKEDVDGGLAEVVAEGEELIDECLEGVGRISSILRDVRCFALGESAPRAEADLGQVIESALRLAERLRPPEVRVLAHVQDLPPLVCAASEIEQVLVNLLTNALHAVGERGTVRLRAEARGADLVIEVEDDGAGIPEDAVDRIFDPFFTTKPIGEGTGLGLSICLRMVRSHGGEIGFDSRVDSGTRFWVRLPREAPGPESA